VLVEWFTKERHIIRQGADRSGVCVARDNNCRPVGLQASSKPNHFDARDKRHGETRNNHIKVIRRFFDRGQRLSAARSTSHIKTGLSQRCSRQFAQRLTVIDRRVVQDERGELNRTP